MAQKKGAKHMHTNANTSPQSHRKDFEISAVLLPSAPFSWTSGTA